MYVLRVLHTVYYIQYRVLLWLFYFEHQRYTSKNTIIITFMLLLALLRYTAWLLHSTRTRRNLFCCCPQSVNRAAFHDRLQLQQNASTSILDQNLPGLHTLRKDFIFRSDYDDGHQMQSAGNKENVIDTWSVTAVVLGRWFFLIHSVLVYGFVHTINQFWSKNRFRYIENRFWCKYIPVLVEFQC